MLFPFKNVKNRHFIKDDFCISNEMPRKTGKNKKDFLPERFHKKVIFAL